MSRYRFQLRPELSPEQVADLRVSVGWDAALDLYRSSLGRSFAWAGCFAQGQLIGYADVVSDGVADAYVRDLVVHPDHQREGVGSRLLSLLVETVRDAGIRMVSTVFEPDLAAFYRRAGFHLVSGGMIDLKPMPVSRPYEAADAPFLWQLHCLLERDEIEQTWGWDEDAQRVRWPQFVDSVTWRIIQMDGVDIGAIAEKEEPEALRLSYIGLEPKFQGRGIGTGLLKELLCRAAAAGKPVKLNVLKVNERAQEFYRRHGFTVSGELDGRYVMEATPAGKSPL